MIKAIIFDMDGVLIDAKEWHYHAFNQALESFGFKIEYNEHIKTYDGLPTAKKLALLTQRCGLPVQLHQEINELKQKFTLSQIYANCKPRDIHQDTLSRLSGEGFVLALASNSIRATVDLMMDKADLKKYLSLTLSSQDVDFPKPSPDIYIKVMETLNLDPRECLIIEDNDHGIRAARASGAYVMVVSDTNQVNFKNIKNFISSIAV